MAIKRMLIDASHPEETRVLVVNGNRLEDFDVEVESRRPLKGNIYLAKVTRVEPSLQAAFVDFGGNRHGFLAFNEIHPDYYQIPVADREALLAEEREAIEKAVKEETVTAEHAAVEVLGGDDSEELEVRRPKPEQRRYKIQEVIKRRQILLVQVVKEERGTKGAALTTYLSLAGRYCVLMPNTDRGGGISRKIGSASDRKKLKKIVSDLGIPDGMAVIVRTAGAERSRAEIRRDYDYLLRLWNQIRETTLNSIAPALVHEEGDLIKRSIRDLYTKDIEEVVVHGEDGYRMAKDFMKILIPSHAKKVQKYKEVDVPLNHFYRIDNQLDVIHSAEVHLKSGGYIVINPTEALVAIDVNSGRATKERNIEETALKTNLEAADEIARQLKLRDLAGLIVIDFIDMEVSRNQTKVERAVKEAMRSDRARIQIGRISPFGLLELSRQRLRPSLIETSSEPCPYCRGSGTRRSTETTAVEVLRALEEEGMRRRDGELTVFVPTDVALYLLNRKRESIAELEQRFNLKIMLENDDTLIPPDLRIERDGEIVGDDKPHRPTSAAEADGVDDGSGRKRKRRRSRRRGRRGEEGEEHSHEERAAQPAEHEHDDEVEDDDEHEHEHEHEHGEDETKPKAAEREHHAEDGEGGDGTKRRRRGRRGGRRRRRRGEGEGRDGARPGNGADGAVALLNGPEAPGLLAPPNSDDGEVIELPDGSEASDGADTADAEVEAQTEVQAEVQADAATEDQGDGGAPKRRRRGGRAKDNGDAEPENEAVAPEAEASAEAEQVEPVAAEPEPAPEPTVKPIVPDSAEQESAKTTVIRVGGDAAETPSRSGWWDRG
jgi:ribonuclease E